MFRTWNNLPTKLRCINLKIVGYMYMLRMKMKTNTTDITKKHKLSDKNDKNTMRRLVR